MKPSEPLVLYLDTSDLSYLARGDVVGGTDYADVREQVADMAAAGMIRLRLSIVHLAECYRLNAKVLHQGLTFLRRLPGTTVCFAGPDAVFQAELDGRRVELDERPLRSLSATPRDLRLRILGQAWPSIARLGAAAYRAARKARASDAVSAKRIHRALLSGDPRQALSSRGRRKGEEPPFRVKLAVLAASPLARRLRQFGFYGSSDSASEHKLQDEGLSWLASYGADRVRRAVAIGTKWSTSAVASMPGCALRISFERGKHLDGNCADEASDMLDALHLAFAGQSDAATVDKRVFHYTLGLHKAACKPRFLFRSGQLSNLLAAIRATTGHNTRQKETTMSVLNRPEVKEVMESVLIRVAERNERGDSVLIRRAPNKKSDYPKILCLDTNIWIYLARAHYDRDGGTRYREALESVRRAIENEKLIVPILGSNLLEASEPMDEARRVRLCRFMVDLSQNHSMVNPRPVSKQELLCSVRTLFQGKTSEYFQRQNIVRWGIFSAIGKEPTCEDELIDQVLYEPELAVYFLAHASDRDSVEEGRRLDKQAQTVAINARKDAGAGELRRRAELSALFESGTVADDLEDILQSEGISKSDFKMWLSQNLLVFAEGTPSIDVQCSLLLARDKNSDHKTHQNDLKDFIFLEEAIPYGNIVVTENSWSHLANTTGLAKKYGTKVIASTTQLPELLREAGCID